MNTSKQRHYLCQTDEIADRAAREFEVEEGGHKVSLFVVNRDQEFYAYRNMCPHALAPLNWQPDQFLDLDKHYIQCSMHGAVFQIDTGLCVWGPCVNQSLWSVELIREDGKLYASFQRKD